MKPTNTSDASSQEKGDLSPKGKILTVCLAPCVHVAGTVNFGNVAMLLGYEVKFLGPAIPVPEIMRAITEEKPAILGISYRLTPETLRPLLQDFFTAFDQVQPKPGRLFFAGTPADAAVAKEFDRFEALFEGGETTTQVIRILQHDRARAQ